MGVAGTKMPRYSFRDHIDPEIKKREEIIESQKKEKDEEWKIMNSPEFSEDLKECIDGRIKSSTFPRASGRNEEEYWMYPVQPGTYSHSALDAAKYRYQKRFKPCACGDPDWEYNGIEASNHNIIGCSF